MDADEREFHAKEARYDLAALVSDAIRVRATVFAMDTAELRNHGGSLYTRAIHVGYHLAGSAGVAMDDVMPGDVELGQAAADEPRRTLAAALDRLMAAARAALDWVNTSPRAPADSARHGDVVRAAAIEVRAMVACAVAMELPDSEIDEE